MITRELARELAQRFAGKPGFPKEDLAIKALIDAIQRAARTEQHARQIAEDLEVESHYCPEPSEVWKVARATDPRSWWSGPKAAPRPKPGEITTYKELIADPDTIELARKFGLAPEELCGPAPAGE